MTRTGREQEKCVPTLALWDVLEELWRQRREDEISQEGFER
ncbi:hypothetical protein [Microvirga zambiensis]|nr:hypothetical protein [Microvirga zambiensis]